MGETFQIWPRNPQQASGNCWQAAQDHNTAINKPDYDGIVDALNRVEQYNCDVVPIWLTAPESKRVSRAGSRG